MKSSFLLVVVGILFLSCQCLGKKIDASTCEVCVKFVQSLMDSLGPTNVASADKVKDAFFKKCETATGKDHTLCYYIGGLKTSAAYTVNRLVEPITWQMPAEKVCEKLSSLDSQICDLKYEKVIDLKEFDFKKAKVKDLRKILSKWGLECRGCSEKKDFIDLIMANVEIHDPEAATHLRAHQDL